MVCIREDWRGWTARASEPKSALLTIGRDGKKEDSREEGTEDLSRGTTNVFATFKFTGYKSKQLASIVKSK